MDRLIDTHVHIWKYNENEFPWIGVKEQVLQRDFMISDYFMPQSSAEECNVILVQTRQCKAENSYLCEQAKKQASVVGVVGWLDLQSPGIGVEFERMKTDELYKKLVGFRHLVQDELDVRFMLRREFIHGLIALKQNNFVYDVLIKRTQFGQLRSLLQTIPESKSPQLVLNHMGKPKVGGTREDFIRWKDDIARVARYPQVTCKISGLLTEMADHARIEDTRPFIEVVFEAFGADRLMLGSDWPVCTLQGAKGESLSVASFLRTQVGEPEWQQISYLTAQRVYGLRN